MLLTGQSTSPGCSSCPRCFGHGLLPRWTSCLRLSSWSSASYLPADSINKRNTSVPTHLLAYKIEIPTQTIGHFLQASGYRPTLGFLRLWRTIRNVEIHGERMRGKSGSWGVGRSTSGRERCNRVRKRRRERSGGQVMIVRNMTAENDWLHESGQSARNRPSCRYLRTLPNMLHDA
jgi:hypothetical protein